MDDENFLGLSFPIYISDKNNVSTIITKKSAYMNS